MVGSEEDQRKIERKRISERQRKGVDDQDNFQYCKVHVHACRYTAMPRGEVHVAIYTVRNYLHLDFWCSEDFELMIIMIAKPHNNFSVN